MLLLGTGLAGITSEIWGDADVLARNDQNLAMLDALARRMI
jgi:hypothetical protein